MMLEQAKKGLCDSIQREGVLLIYVTWPLKDDGFGGKIFDTSQPEIIKKVMVRIALDTSGPVGNTEGTAGLSSNLSRMIIFDYRFKPLENAVIRGLEREYRINIVTPLIKFGGIYGYQAILEEGT